MRCHDPQNGQSYHKLTQWFEPIIVFLWMRNHLIGSNKSAWQLIVAPPIIGFTKTNSAITTWDIHQQCFAVYQVSEACACVSQGLSEVCEVCGVWERSTAVPAGVVGGVLRTVVVAVTPEQALGRDRGSAAAIFLAVVYRYLPRISQQHGVQHVCWMGPDEEKGLRLDQKGFSRAEWSKQRGFWYNLSPKSQRLSKSQ